MYSSMSRPFPGTPARGHAQLGASQNNKDNFESGAYTPPNPRRSARKRASLTPRRSMVPSPAPDRMLGGAGPSSNALLSASTSGGAALGASTMSGQSSTGFGGIRYRVVANDAQLRQVMERDQSYMDRAAREVRDARSEWRRQHEEMKVELVEEERRWENECERLRKEGAQMVKTLDSEKREIQEYTSAVNNLESRKRELAASVDALRIDIEECTAKMQARREFNAQERQAYERQAKKDAPELAYFEERTGLKILGKPRDVVSFTFTALDPADHKRSFFFDLDASDTQYRVPVCKPSLSASKLSKLVTELDNTGDLSAFLQDMRAAFVELVAS